LTASTLARRHRRGRHQTRIRPRRSATRLRAFLAKPEMGRGSMVKLGDGAHGASKDAGFGLYSRVARRRSATVSRFPRPARTLSPSRPHESRIPFDGRRVLRRGASIELGRGVRDGGDPGGSGPPASREIDIGARSSVLYTAEASERRQRDPHARIQRLRTESWEKILPVGPTYQGKDCICARLETGQRTRLANDTGRQTRWPHMSAPCQDMG
jgi:hypothetical protein